MTESLDLLIYKQLCGPDPAKLAALDAYVTLLAASDDEDGKPTGKRKAYKDSINVQTVSENSSSGN
jgi:hypothetical protein